MRQRGVIRFKICSKLDVISSGKKILAVHFMGTLCAANCTKEGEDTKIQVDPNVKIVNLQALLIYTRLSSIIQSSQSTEKIGDIGIPQPVQFFRFYLLILLFWIISKRLMAFDVFFANILKMSQLVSTVTDQKNM